MSSLLNAVNTDSNKFIIGELPINSGDVSIVTVEELFNLLKDKSSLSYDSTLNYESVFDTNSNNPTYYMYYIADAERSDPTLDSLKEVSIDWYKQLNMSTKPSQTFSVNNKVVYGGPLFCIDLFNSGDYDLGWYSFEGSVGDSYYDYCWHSYVKGLKCVAIVRAHE